MKKFKLIIVFVFCLLVCAGITAQSHDSGSEIPQGIISLLVVPDSKSPVEIIPPYRILGYANGGFDLGYTLRNSSNKSIESFEIREWNWLSSHGYERTFNIKDDRAFAPGMSKYSLEEEKAINLVPFSQNSGLQARASLKSNKLWLVMVVKVRLSDGSLYDASKKYEELEKFLESRPTNTIDLDRWENDLRLFVSNLMLNRD